jgi:hypothetical protein
MILEGTQRSVLKASLSLDDDQHVGDRLPGETHAGFYAVRNLGCGDLALFPSSRLAPIYFIVGAGKNKVSPNLFLGESLPRSK